MRILLLSEGNPETRDSWSGTSKSVVEHLRAAGHEVVPGDVELYGWRRWLAAGLTFAPSKPRWRWRFRLGGVPFALRGARASGVARAHAADAILQIGATFRVRRHTGIPLFLYCDSNIRLSEAGRATGHSEASRLTRRESKAIAAREAEVYEGADGIFTMSERLRRSFVENFGVEGRRVHTIHAGPNFDPQEFDVPRAPRAAGHPPTVLFVGKAFERKGGDILLAAFRKVRGMVPSARLRIIGPPHPLDDQPGVVWDGLLRSDDATERRRLIQAYLDADVFCLPTRFEPFGIVFLEAMYAGLPCIGPDAWAVPEMIVHGETGWLVPADDAEALAGRLIEVLQDPEQARRMGEAGRARARSYFTWPATVERMLAVIRQHVGGGPPAGV
jgi:glycosyltransferase involved in cell wall biosynthesis